MHESVFWLCFSDYWADMHAQVHSQKLIKVVTTHRNLKVSQSRKSVEVHITEQCRWLNILKRETKRCEHMRKIGPHRGFESIRGKICQVSKKYKNTHRDKKSVSRNLKMREQNWRTEFLGLNTILNIIFSVWLQWEWERWRTTLF